MIKIVYFLLIFPLGLYSQYQYNDFSYKPTIPLIGSGTGLLIGGNIMSKSIKPLTVDEISRLSRLQLDGLDRTATYNYDPSAKKISDVLMLSAIAIPTITIINKDAREHIDKMALLTAETYLLTIGTTFINKNLIKRTRPYVYNELVPLSEKVKKDARMSFFSGHTSFTATTTFFTASMLQQNPDNKALMPYVWTSAALVPAITGIMRWKAGKHFPTDIFIGYVVGMGIGILVPKLH